MPFMKNNHSLGPQPSSSPVLPLLIGRSDELHMFVHEILQPNVPLHNILSISGQGGVGKSTLLVHFIAEAQKAPFNSYCQTAIVDEHLANPINMMERFAQQLHITGTFEKTLRQYKEALRKQEPEREQLSETLFQSIPDLAGAAMEGIPIAGPLLREGTKIVGSYLLKKDQSSQVQQEAKLSENFINYLTKAFVSEINRRVEENVRLGSIQQKRKRRIVLFFDTFEQLAPEVNPWLLNHFLTNEVNSNVILVVAGRDPIERSSPKPWLLYKNDIARIALSSFTEEDTFRYLVAKGIIEEDQMTNIWQLSLGLPLFLELLTANPGEEIDPTKDVVSNFLCRIPEHEHIKLQLSLDASLFSKPFNQDDLEAFGYIPSHEGPRLYHWLTDQTFVQRRFSDGQYLYHEVAQELFSRHLYQLSPKHCLETRRSLISYYQQQLEEMQAGGGEGVCKTKDWLETSQALVHQLLLLPDEKSHIRAIDWVLSIYKYADEVQEISKVLCRLSQERPYNQTNSNARRIANCLLLYIQNRQPDQELASVDSLLEIVAHEPSFSSTQLAFIYRRRARFYMMRGEEHEAIINYNRAIEIAPKEPRTYSDRGNAYRWLGDYQKAMKDFNYALELNPKNALAYSYRALVYLSQGEYAQADQDCKCALDINSRNGWAYICRSMVYRDIGEYQRAIDACNQALQLDPQSASRVHLHRGINYRKLKKYQLAIQDFDRAIELDHFYYLNYIHRAVTYEELKVYQLALQDLDQAIELSPHCELAYSRRAFVYLKVNNTQQAFADYMHCKELEHKNMNAAWMAQWSRMCQEKADRQTAAYLEEIALIGLNDYIVYLCLGLAAWLRGNCEQALVKLEQASITKTRECDAFFWKGIILAFIGQDEEAMISIRKALELGMPPILLTPLRWLEQEKFDFYEQHIVPLLEIHGVNNVMISTKSFYEL